MIQTDHDNFFKIMSKHVAGFLMGIFKQTYSLLRNTHVTTVIQNQ